MQNIDLSLHLLLHPQLLDLPFVQNFNRDLVASDGMFRQFDLFLQLIHNNKERTIIHPFDTFVCIESLDQRIDGTCGFFSKKSLEVTHRFVSEKLVSRNES